MALDFTTASLDSRVTFTRSGNTATVINSSGLIAPINANLPRFDFDPIALTCKGLLIEEARTNLWTYSDDFSNAVWNKTRGSITSNSIISPDGTQNADTFVEDAATGNHYVLQSATIVAGDTCSSSIYLKAAGRRYVQLLMDANNLVDFVYAYFDLQTGTITQAAQVQGTATLPAASITSMGNGWYRCTVSAKLGAISVVGRLFTLPTNVPTGASLASIAGLNAASYYCWGGQFEVGAFPTSYIPTVASQVTRTADTATMTGTNFSSWYNASEGAFVVSAVIARQSSAGATAIFSANDNTSANLINCFYRASGALGANIFASSISQLDQTQLGVTAANVIVNTGVAYKLNNSVSYANATVQTTDTSVTVPTINQLQLGFTPTGAYLNGWVRNLRFWKQRILNAEGQAFSK
jgi:hypothetical protein